MSVDDIGTSSQAVQIWRPPQKRFKILCECQLRKRRRKCKRNKVLPSSIGSMDLCSTVSTWTDPVKPFMDNKSLSDQIEHLHLTITALEDKINGSIISTLLSDSIKTVECGEQRPLVETALDLPDDFHLSLSSLQENLNLSLSFQPALDTVMDKILLSFGEHNESSCFQSFLSFDNERNELPEEDLQAEDDSSMTSIRTDDNIELTESLNHVERESVRPKDVASSQPDKQDAKDGKYIIFLSFVLLAFSVYVVIIPFFSLKKT